MLFGGLQKTTLVDYPGKVAATVFTLGCNFRCPFCHNPELVLPELIAKQPRLTEKEILKFLKDKQGLLEGLCVTVGEPTLQLGLESFLLKVKKLSYQIKLDSNGSQPQLLEKLIDQQLVDYVALDLKTSLEKYDLLTLGEVPKESILASINLLKKGKVAYEFRTTLAPGIVTEEDVSKIVELIKGAPRYFLQKFRPTAILDPTLLKQKQWEEATIIKVCNQIKPYFGECAVR